MFPLPLNPPKMRLAETHLLESRTSIRCDPENASTPPTATLPKRLNESALTVSPEKTISPPTSREPLLPLPTSLSPNPPLSEKLKSPPTLMAAPSARLKITAVVAVDVEALILKSPLADRV